MTEHLTMNTIFHAAFRGTVARFDQALGDFPDGSGQRAQELYRAWAFFDDELHHHHDYEEQFFWPALAQTDADLSSVAELDDEHGAMRAALEKATAAMTTLRDGPTAQNAASARTAVAHLGEVLLGHLDHEERDLEPIMAAHVDAPSMKTALANVKKAHFKAMGNTIEWVRDTAPADAAAMREHMPPPVLFLFRTIGGRRYRREIAPVWA